MLLLWSCKCDFYAVSLIGVPYISSKKINIVIFYLYDKLPMNGEFFYGLAETDI